MSEKKMVLDWASKSIPIKEEGLPVIGTMTSSWVERVNGIPRTAIFDEKRRKFLTAGGREKKERGQQLYSPVLLQRRWRCSSEGNIRKCNGHKKWSLHFCYCTSMHQYHIYSRPVTLSCVWGGVGALLRDQRPGKDALPSIPRDHVSHRTWSSPFLGRLAASKPEGFTCPWPSHAVPVLGWQALKAIPGLWNGCCRPNLRPYHSKCCHPRTHPPPQSPHHRFIPSQDI